MKVILSKKGLDSSFSKNPIPILDEKLIFVPIPNEQDILKYGDLKNLNRFIEVTGQNKSFLETHCHLDPQLENYFNCENFKGSLGQIEGFQTHLEKNSVEVGDLFLFYGWYLDVINDNLHKNGKHVIWGYMQIGEIIKPETLNESERKELEKKYPWLKYQPHWNSNKYKNIKNNTIYIAKDTCTFDKNLKGYGILDYTISLDLTDKDNKNRSHWKIEGLSNCKTSYKSLNGKQDFNELGQYEVPARCQEIVINDEKAERWAIDLIKRHTYQNKSITILNEKDKNLNNQIKKLSKPFSKNQILDIDSEKFFYYVVNTETELFKFLQNMNYKLLIIKSVQFLKDKSYLQIIFLELLKSLIVKEVEIILSTNDSIDKVLDNQELIKFIKKHAK